MQSELKEKIIATAVSGFGIEKQRIKCVEELSELIKELCKDAIGQGSKFHIAEEIADCEIMLAQMKHYYGIDVNVEFFVENKLEQLEEKLGIGGYDE